MHTCMRTCMHTCMRTCMRTCMHTWMHGRASKEHMGDAAAEAAEVAEADAAADADADADVDADGEDDEGTRSHPLRVRLTVPLPAPPSPSQSVGRQPVGGAGADGGGGDVDGGGAGGRALCLEFSCMHVPQLVFVEIVEPAAYKGAAGGLAASGATAAAAFTAAATAALPNLSQHGGGAFALPPAPGAVPAGAMIVTSLFANLLGPDTGTTLPVPYSWREPTSPETCGTLLPSPPAALPTLGPRVDPRLAPPHPRLAGEQGRRWRRIDCRAAHADSI